MDNIDFVDHLINTSNTLHASVEVVEDFIRSYYYEMHSVTKKWHGLDFGGDGTVMKMAFAEIRVEFDKYWLPDSRFSEYWQPTIEPPEVFEIDERSGITIYSDMLGNFVCIVIAADQICVYLLSVIRDELRILNRFFR